MKVTISVPGRLHGFDLAREIQAHGHLKELVSSYPFFMAHRFGIQKMNYHSLLSWELMARGLRKVRPLYKNFWNEQYFIAAGFDRAVANYLKAPMDIFVGWSGNSLFSLRQAKKLGAKVIIERGSAHISVQTEILKREYESLGMKFNETHEGVIARELEEYQEADFISIPSHFVRNSFIERGIPAEKLIQIPYGVNLDQFYSEERSRPDKFRIIFCGTVCLRKGAHYLLEAFHSLNHKDMELWFVGSMMDEMRPFFKKYAHPNIHIFGKVSQKELRQYYSQCALFCLPSLEEGFAMVVSQAMACGLPVLCTTNTGALDIIREGLDGFSVPIKNVDKLKEKILFFYENPDQTHAMGLNARKQVQNAFLWKDYGNKMVSGYQKILEK